MFKKILNYYNNIKLTLAEKQAFILSSMEFYFICVSIDLVVLFIQPPDTVSEWCTFISQTCIQLLALPVLAFVSNLSSNKVLKYIEDLWQWMKEVKEEEKEEINILKDINNKLLEELNYYKKESNGE